jgi:hypothetical protein
MNQRSYFLFAPIGGFIFFGAVYALAPMVDGYSHVAQTISEIGQQGSPAELYLRMANLIVGFCLLVFARSLYVFTRGNSASKLPAFFMAWFAIAEIGMAAFPSPHALHNVIGLSMSIGYMTPLVLALSWRNLPGSGRLIGISWVAFILVVTTMALNLTPAFAPDLYPLEYYGIVQRSLFVAFYGWCAYAGINLYLRP